MSRPRALAGLHAGYLTASGIWPILHRESFERVTGRKRDFWLVRTVGGLAAVMGVTLGVAVLRGRRSHDAKVLAVGSAVAFGAADVYAGSRLSRVYLGDLVLQAALLPAWFAPWEQADAAPSPGARRRKEPRSPGL
jgi:hypothetical protein